MRRFKSACQQQRFVSVHDQVANQLMNCRYNCDAKLRTNKVRLKLSITCCNQNAHDLLSCTRPVLSVTRF